MLQQENGPGAVFAKFQAWFWTGEAKPGSLKDGLRCFNCTSVWLSFFAALAIQDGNFWHFLLYWFAIAAGAMYLNDIKARLEQR